MENPTIYIYIYIGYPYFRKHLCAWITAISGYKWRMFNRYHQIGEAIWDQPTDQVDQVDQVSSYLQGGAPKIANLVNITTIKLGFMALLNIVR